MHPVRTLVLIFSLGSSGSNAIAGSVPFDGAWPDSMPSLVAPCIINTDGIEINLVFNRDNSELCFSRTVDKLFFVNTSRLVDGSSLLRER